MVTNASEGFQRIPTHNFLSSFDQESNDIEDQRHRVVESLSKPNSKLATQSITPISTATALQEATSRVSTTFQSVFNPSTPEHYGAATQIMQTSSQSVEESTTLFLQQRGLFHLNKNEFALAISFFQQGIRVNTLSAPENRASDETIAFLFALLGRALEKSDDLDGAISAWREGLNFANGQQDIQSALYTFLGNAHYQRGEFQMTLCAYRSALFVMTSPSATQTLNQISTYVQTMQVSPLMEENAMALLKDGVKYCDKRDFKKAIAILRLSLLNQSVNPQCRVSDQTNALLHFWLGHALLQSKHFDEAVSTWQKGLAYKNAIPDTLSNLHSVLGHAYSQKNEIHMAIGYFRLALRIL